MVGGLFVWKMSKDGSPRHISNLPMVNRIPERTKWKKTQVGKIY